MATSVKSKATLGKSGAYEGLAYTQAELKDVMRIHYDKIIDFITSESFKQVLYELSAMSHLTRPQFVHDVLLNDKELQKRGINVPPGILIQRSAFGDRRPTLFAVKHFLPKKYANVWQNVNITFDNKYLDHEVTREKPLCWRAPLPPDIQANEMAAGTDLECVMAQ